MVNSKYKVTHVNSAGDNLEHQITGAVFTNIGGLTYSSNLFSQFSDATVKLDLSKPNLDYVRKSPAPPPAKEAHAYILFQF